MVTVKEKNIDKLLKRYYYGKPGRISECDNWISLLSRYVNKNHRVLDLGCGQTNKYTKLLTKLSDNIVGLDVDDKVLENIHLKEAYVYDREKLPFEKNTFDIVVSHAVMEHIKYPDLIIMEIARILKRGGYFISCQPNRFHYIVALGSIIPYNLRLKVNSWARGENLVKDRDFYPTFYRFNTPRTCKSLLIKNGFEITKFSMLEDAPFYHAGNRFLFMSMMAYERIVNYIELLSNCRSSIQFVAHKL